MDGTDRPDRGDRTVRGRCTTPDGVGIATYDFGGDGPDLLLVHATGFCATVLGPLAAGPGRRLPLLGARPPLPRALRPSDRRRLRLVGLRHRRPGHPSTSSASTARSGFGHSCGGAALLLAEQRRPGTFRALYGFEPVVLPADPVPPSFENNPLSERGAAPTGDVPLARPTPSSTSPPSRRSTCLDPDALRPTWRTASSRSRPTRVGTARPSGCGAAARTRPGSTPTDRPTMPAPHLGEVGCPTDPGLRRPRPTPSDRGPGAGRRRAAPRQPPSRSSPDLGHFGPLERPDRGGRLGRAGPSTTAPSHTPS